MTRRRGRLRGAAAALILACGLVGASLAPPAEPSDAAFVDSEHTSGTLTALKLVEPEFLSVPTCNSPLLNLPGTQIDVRWKWPDAVSTTAPYAYPAAAAVSWSFAGAAETTQIGTTSYDAGTRTYTTSFRYAGLLELLGTLLASLLGGDFEITGRTTWTPAGQSTTWSSNGVDTVYVDRNLINITCSL